MSYPSLKITLLGTGTSSGVPMIACDCEVCTSPHAYDKRLRSSILVQSQTTSIAVDAGPDFRQQMLQHRVSRLDAVLLTHSHKDHIAGLDDIRAFNYFQEKPMDVYASADTLQRVQTEFDYAFSSKKIPGVPVIRLHPVEETRIITIGDLHIQPILVWHMKMPVLGFRFGNFTYITDANYIPETSRKKIAGSSVLVINALRREPHISHFTLEEAVAVANDLQIPEVFFTHISHQMGKHETVNASLPANRRLAYDGMTIVL